MNETDTAPPTTPPPHPTAPAAPTDEAVIDEKVGRDRQRIIDAKGKGTLATLGVYTRLSGPGWLQSAITLGGGSLAGSLYLGVLMGPSIMWLQPLALLLGIIMLSAIGYVALSTGERPFHAVNRHVNPVLGWGWIIATIMANMVWCLPQFTLGIAAIQQNLLPGVFGEGAALSGLGGTILCTAFLLLTAGAVIWLYDSGGRGIRIFEGLLKVMIGTVVISFICVVGYLGGTGDLNWGAVFAGFVPDFGLLFGPAETFEPALAAAGEHAPFWRERILGQQRDVMIAAFATAVGINMTFLMPYSLLARGWDRHFRGLLKFDLATGLFIPFVLATSCVIIAASSQFHAHPAPGLLGASASGVEPAATLVTRFEAVLDERVAAGVGGGAFAAMSPAELAGARAGLPEADRRLAAMLVKRDAFNLADALAPLTGDVIGRYLFGIGVLGMAISTIIILMLINGFAICEVFNVPPRGSPHRMGCFLAGIVGAMGPFVWAGNVQFWLAVPTSVFGMVLLPVAYITFAMMMNQRELLGENLPRGGRRIVWNILMAVAATVAALASFWVIWSKAGWYGIGGLIAFVGLAIVVHFVRQRPGEGEEPATAG